MIEVKMPDQKAKKDAGKPRLSLVPTQIIYDICKVREFAVDHKYKDPDNWKNVDIQRYRDAAYRHFLLYLRDPDGVDEESGLPHYFHLCCNLAFICEIEAGNVKRVDTKKELKVEPEDDFVFIDFDPVIKEHKSNIDFDEDDREDNKNNWMDLNEVKPPMTGKYEFKYDHDLGDVVREGYYIKDYDIVCCVVGEIWPRYWRYM